MPQSLTNFDNALKEIYEPGLRNAINNSNVVWAEAIKNTEDLVGEEAVWSVHSGRSNSTGARGELAALPTADRQRYIKARKGLSYQYHTIKVSGQANHLTRNDKGAFARALESELKNGEKDMKNSMSRQVFGQALTDGTNLLTGVIATLSADPGTGTTLTFANEDESVMRHFYVGMYIQAYNPSGGAARTGGPYEVTAISKSARTVTIGSAANAAIASGDYVCQTSSDGGLGFGKEMDGLRHILSSGTYAGIDPSTNPAWAVVTAGSTSTGISEVLLEEAGEAVETDGDGSSADEKLFVCEHVQRRKLASILQAQKRYDGRDMTLTSGWKGLQLSRGTLVADRYCPTTYIFGIHRPELQKFVGLDFQWDDDDGKVLYKALDGSDAVEARFKGYVQLAATNRNSHVVTRVAAPSF